MRLLLPKTNDWNEKDIYNIVSDKDRRDQTVVIFGKIIRKLCFFITLVGKIPESGFVQ